MIQPNEIPKVALDCLNKDHQEVADIVNCLASHLSNSSTSTKDITDTIQQLREHLENHFACEEHQMEKYQFPALNIHRGEHHRVLDEINQIQSNWLTANNPQVMQNYLSHTFCPWLIEHISTLDTQTARYIVDSGGS